VDFEPAAHLFGEALGGGQAEAGAGGLVVAGVEGVEDALEILGEDAGAAVGDVDADVRGHGLAGAAVEPEGGAEVEVAAVGHGFDGVADEVGEGLAGAGGVDAEVGQAGFDEGAEADGGVGGGEAAGDVEEAAEEGVGGDAADFEQGLASGLLELGDEARSTSRRR
jgi:hypothetical protein